MMVCRIRPRRSVDPAIEPWTLAEAKLAARALQDVSDEDGLFDVLVRAAREAFELNYGYTALTSTWVLTPDTFEASAIDLPMAAPLQSVSSVKYYDTAGVQQTLSTAVYRVDTESTPGRIVLKPDQVWPDIQVTRGQAVEVTYVAGWTAAELMPSAVRSGMLSVITHLWEHRSSVEIGVGIGAVEVPMTASWLWAPYELWDA